MAKTGLRYGVLCIALALGCGVSHEPETQSDSGAVERVDAEIAWSDAGPGHDASAADASVTASDAGNETTVDAGASLDSGVVSDTDVSVASVTLESDCRANAEQGIAADCAPGFAACGCIQSRMSLRIASSGFDGEPEAFRVVGVRILDSSRRVLDEVAAGGPEVFNGDEYIAWNELVPSSHELQVRYALTAPDWESIYQTTGSQRYAALELWVEVRVEIGGEIRVLEYGPAMREPEIVT